LSFLANENGIQLMRKEGQEIPPFLQQLIAKHSHSLSIEHLKVISSWPPEIIGDSQTKILLFKPISDAITRFKDLSSEKKQELLDLLPKLSRLTNFGFKSPDTFNINESSPFSDVVYMKENKNRPQNQQRFMKFKAPAKGAPQAVPYRNDNMVMPTSAPIECMTFSNCMMQQSANPVIGASLGMRMQQQIQDIDDIEMPMQQQIQDTRLDRLMVEQECNEDMKHEDRYFEDSIGLDDDLIEEYDVKEEAGEECEIPVFIDEEKKEVKKADSFSESDGLLSAPSSEDLHL